MAEVLVSCKVECHPCEVTEDREVSSLYQICKFSLHFSLESRFSLIVTISLSLFIKLYAPNRR